MSRRPSREELENRIRELEGTEIALKRVKKALRKSERDLTAFQKLAHAGSWDWNVITGEVEWSDEVYTIFGVDPLDFKPRIDSVMSRFHPEDQLRHEELIARLVENRESYSFEARILLPDQTVREVLSTAQGQFHKEGKLTRIIGIVQDITDRKRVENALKENRNFIDKIINTAPNLVYIYDMVEKRNVFSNDGIKRLLGFSARDIQQMGEHLFPTLVHPDDARKVAAHHALLKKSGDGEIFEIDYRIRNHAGEYRILRSWDTVFKRHDDGSAKQIIGLAADVTKQIRAVQALKESEEQYRLIFESADVMVSVYDRNGICQLMNRKVAALFGGDPSDFMGRSFEELHPDRGKEYTRRVREVIDSAISRDFEDEVAFPEGNHWLLSKVHPVRDVHGTITTAQIVSQDITDRKRAEKKLRESERRLSSHLAETPVGAISWNMDFEVVDWNPAAENIFGYTREEALGKSGADLIVPEDIRETILNVFQKLLAQEGGTLNLNENITKDGRRIICEWYNTTLAESDGRVLGVASFVHDVTERIKTARDLEEERNTAQRYLDLAGVIFVALNREGIVTLINRKGCEVLGYDHEEIVGKNWFEHFIPQRIRDELIPISRQLLSGHMDPVEYHENEILTKDGKERLIAWHNTILKDKNGNITGHLSSGEDITEKRQLRAALQQRRKMEAIGNLAGGIAHEFNNVLGIILGNAELAMDDVPDWNPAKESLREIRNATFRAKEVVRQILSFARKTMTALKPLDINTTVKESLKLMRASIPTMVDIQTTIPAEPKMILGDPTEIHQIVINLCTNAAHAMKEKGGILEVGISKIRLDQRRAAHYEGLNPGDFVRLIVKDSGQGMTPDVLEKAFEPYFTTKEFGAGSGMGLAVVYGIVKQCDGAINIESTVHEGTTVEILLPKIEEEAPPAEKAEGELPRGGERILVVDDDPSIVTMICQTLERLGYIATGMTGSVKALERFRSNPDEFDMVITDMAMPGMPGDQLAVELMKAKKGIPILLCTGHSDTVDEKRATQLGIKGFAMKPLDKGKLARTVRDVLDSP